MRIELKNCHIKIGKKTILKDVCFKLQKEDFIHLKGKNGSGKTVLMQSLLGFNKITKGQRHSEYLKSSICYIPDVPFFNANETVHDVLKATAYFYDSDLVSLYKILDFLNFDETVKMSQKIITISKGSKKKLELIPLFLKPLKLYFLDEITHGLDTDSLIVVCARLKELHELKATIVLIEHNQHITNYLSHIIPDIKEVTCVNQKLIIN